MRKRIIHEGVPNHESKGHGSVWHHHVKVGAVMITDDPVLAIRNVHGIPDLLNKTDEQNRRLNQRQQSKLAIAYTSQNQQPKLLGNETSRHR